MYDIIFIGNNEQAFSRLRERFPTSKKVTIKTDILDAFNEARRKAFTKMFWVVWDDLVIAPEFKFDYKIDPWDEQYVHLFLNGTSYDGICLFSKVNNVSKRELSCRFFINKKEVSICASHPVAYDKFEINTYDEYLEATQTSSTNMFWCIWDDVIVRDDFDFNYQVPAPNHHLTHVFKNGEYYDGICLFSKNTPVTKKEFNYRFFTNKKEIDIIASTPKKFEIFNISSYDEYLKAIERSSTNMFWCIWDDVIVRDDFDFNYQVPAPNQYIPHVFKNGEYYDGICLFSKSVTVSQKEFNYRFFTNKKEIDIIASTPKPFDVVFISYFEKFADENFQKMLSHLHPNQSAYRVNGIKGIHRAHKCAAEIVKSDMFWVVDADAILMPEFNFDFPQVLSHDTYTKSIVHVWRSCNPINDLEYGYGGVKLLPKKLTMNMDMSNPDMTTSISASFKAMPEVSNVAGFNTDPFTTWRSAFRECVKLASKTIRGQVDAETEERLDIWCTVGKDRPFGKYAISGAKAGRDYGQKNAGDIPALSLINDYDWLKSQFEQTRQP